jgi:hypothetical protein
VDVGGVAHKKKWRLWGRTFTNASRGEGLRAKKPKSSAMERDGLVSSSIRTLRGAGGPREVKYPPAAVI